jgi:hypothetical protein
VINKWELLDPAGHSLWGFVAEFPFLHNHSKYYKKTKRGWQDSQARNPFVMTEYYDFRGRDQREAITDELLDYVVLLGLPKDFPQGPLLSASGIIKVVPFHADFPMPEKDPAR